jgi:hypothetical protein
MTGKEDDIYKENSKCRTGRGDKQANRLTGRTGKKEDRKEGRHIDRRQAGDQADKSTRRKEDAGN